MGFSTQIFVFAFLPLCLLAYFLTDALGNVRFLAGFVKRFRCKDIVLILTGCVFYAWAFFDDLWRIWGYILVVYALGALVSHFSQSGTYLAVYRQDDTSLSTPPAQKLHIAKIAAFLAVLCVLFFLCYTKYYNLLISVWNKIFRDSVPAKSIPAMLGISFITFSAISYIVDIYRGNAPAGNLIDCALYLLFFPKLVSGPIVLWKDFHPQVHDRAVTLDGVVSGMNRIVIGLAKKLILADQFGAYIRRMSQPEIDVVTAWAGAFLYMLQIYFDFAGYSDIAIGLSEMFGFHFKNNFNFPYRSKSVTEFWRRWHISLGTWFREYVYIPLGGNRKGMKRTLINLGIVFVLTGLWHGAGWNYLIWGAVNGAFVLLERVIRDKKAYQKTPGLVKWFFTMLITLFLWQTFRFQHISEVVNWLRILFRVKEFESVPYTWRYFLDSFILFAAVAGSLGATVLGSKRLRKKYAAIAGTKVGFIVQELVLLVLFVLSLMFMVNATYSPFIYFQY